MKNDSMIYMVQLGENSEGVYDTALHATREGAEAKARAWMEASSFEWEEVTPYGGRLAMWCGGCDYIQIFTQKIEG